MKDAAAELIELSGSNINDAAKEELALTEPISKLAEADMAEIPRELIQLEEHKGIAGEVVWLNTRERKRVNIVRRSLMMEDW